MDRLDRVEKILEKLAKLQAKSQAKADRQRAKDRAEADRQRAKDRAEADRQRAKDKAEADRRQQEIDFQRAKDKADAERRQQEIDRQRAKDKEDADRQRAKDKAEADRQRAKDKEDADRRQQEADRQRAKDRAEDDRRRQEADRRRQEADRRLEENDRLISSISKNVRGLGTSVGEITEAITVSGKIIALVNDFSGIKVDSFIPNIERTYMLNPDGKLEGDNRRQIEIDGLAIGKSEAVVIEAKTKLGRQDVDAFIKLLTRFKEAFSEYADRDIYACVAFVRANDKTLTYAETRGLFVIRATPPDVKLMNSEGFKPSTFA